MAKSATSKRSTPPVAADQAPSDGSDPLHGRAFVPLDLIDASALRTRDLNEKHVVALAESIGAIGLIHPPAVDRSNRLLAGAHRVAALRWLHGHAHARFLELFPEGLVPVWRMSLEATSDVDLALAVEISENEQRRDYSTSEILKLAERLRAAGFHYSVEGGRPKTDTRPLMPALESIVGKSVRQLRRILNPATAPAQAPSLKTRPSDLVTDLKHFVEASRDIATRLGSASAVPEVFTLKAQLDRTNRLADLAVSALTASAEAPAP